MLVALVGCQAVPQNQNTPTPPATNLVVSQAQLDFGTVAVGSSKTLTDTVSNPTTSAITVTQASVSASGFEISSPAFPATLNPGANFTLRVTFHPAAPGAQTGTVSLLRQSSSNQSVSTTLVASGMAVTPTAAGHLTASSSSLNFGNVQVGNIRSLSETITNSGGMSVTISQVTPSGTGVTLSGLSVPVTLNPGQTATLTVNFAPLSSGSLTGGLKLVSDADNPTLNIALSGTGVTPAGTPAVLAANPTSLTFGNVAAASSKTLSQTLTNSGGSALTISQIAPSGTGFSFTGINPPVTLSAGQSFTFNVTFTPATAGSVSGALSVTSNASNPNLAIPLSATGIAAGQLALAPTSLNFGNVTVGTSLAQSATLTATGASVTVSSASLSSTEFALSGISLPATIAVGSSTPFPLTFTPQASGTASANLSFASNASTTPTVQSLTGNGTAPTPHSVALSWNASTSTNVVGYNVYRGTVSGGPYAQINSALNAGTNDTDTTVQNGHTYYYVVTAVDSNGNESVFSNQVQTVIP
jgi:hypothetical protein